MSALTTLERIKLTAKDDASIQALDASDPAVLMILDDVDLAVQESIFGSYTELAQRYLATHFLSLQSQPVGGRGPLSSYSIGGISRTFTLPYINQKTVLGSTQYGLMFMEIRDMCIVPYATVLTGGLGI
jgi:hypothetical protein